MRYLPLILLLLLVVPVSGQEVYFSEDLVVDTYISERFGGLDLYEHSLFRIILSIVDNPNYAMVNYTYSASGSQFYGSNASSEYAHMDRYDVSGIISDDFAIVNYHNMTTDPGDDYDLGISIIFEADANVTVSFELIVDYSASKRLDFRWQSLLILYSTFVFLIIAKRVKTIQ